MVSAAPVLPLRDPRPGFRPERLVSLSRQVVEEMGLDLTGRTVLTEAATGAYAVTPVIAALAGARVIAVTRSTRYGSVEEVREVTGRLASLAGVEHAVEVVDGKSAEHLASADVVTNSGHLRPITADDVEHLRASAVLPLMFEAWEIQAGRVDLDLDALARRGIRTAGTNERHPKVDVFSYLGPMAVWQLAGAGVPVYRAHVVVLCDNAFAPYVVDGLRRAGATVSVLDDLDGEVPASSDAVLLAMTPTGSDLVGGKRAERWAATGATLVQYWGDVDRDTCREAGLSVWPPQGPATGHMAVLPSDIGPDAIVRLQAGGLKVGEVLLRDPATWTDDDREYVDEL